MSILIIPFAILTAVLWIWAFVDIIRSRFENSAIKGLWILLIFIFPVLGSLIYFQFGKKYIEKQRKFNPDFNRTS
ncbi:PLDc_N domain-containing protein [Antarcticibacterium arcticum]|uniref:PLDc_N domain-containing protein n=1 Tax=Antarcticibacterium arcticum TaxID=2585771 RepID=A0A5B8YMJ2_9FLAO|nr:PLD nuclease N-terminal domain-containing protein [Antarcticibacterium arcticum]QED36979.1 PLDc_N domain-containing protein [Antarcticibacterium arcticum]